MSFYIYCVTHVAPKTCALYHWDRSRLQIQPTYNMQFDTYQAEIFQHINCENKKIKKITYLPMTLNYVSLIPIQSFSITAITSVVLGVTSHPRIFSGIFAAISSPSATCL